VTDIPDGHYDDTCDDNERYSLFFKTANLTANMTEATVEQWKRDGHHDGQHDGGNCWTMKVRRPSWRPTWRKQLLNNESATAYMAATKTAAATTFPVPNVQYVIRSLCLCHSAAPIFKCNTQSETGIRNAIRNRNSLGAHIRVQSNLEWSSYMTLYDMIRFDMIWFSCRLSE